MCNCRCDVQFCSLLLYVFLLWTILGVIPLGMVSFEVIGLILVLIILSLFFLIADLCMLVMDQWTNLCEILFRYIILSFPDCIVFAFNICLLVPGRLCLLSCSYCCPHNF